MSTLTVPINLQALRATEASTRNLAGPTTDFSSLPALNKKKAPNTADRVINELLKDSGSLHRGIHLHWQLPDAVARGRQHEDGTVRFPRAPDRWLVTRVLWNKNGEQATAAQWVVESDRLFEGEPGSESWAPGQQKPAVTAPVGWDKGGTPYRHQGVTYRLRDWPPTDAQSALRVRDLKPEAGHGLDARGHSGAGFAAYYQDCAGIFGFHDPLEDLVMSGEMSSFELEFTASYHVCGWHSQPDEDPLSGLATDRARLAALGKAWSLPANDNDLPQRSLYAGSLHRLTWSPREGNSFEKEELYPDNPPVPKALTIAIGSSTSEALAALLTKTPPDNGWVAHGDDVPAEIAKTPEYLLDALQLGLLHRVHPTSALAELEVALHRQGFATSPGGRVWSLGPSGDKKNSEQKTGEGGGKNGEEEESAPTTILATEGQLSSALTALNVLQSQLDALLRVIASLQRQIYLDWFHYHQEMFTNSGDLDDYQQHVKAMLALLVEKAVLAWGSDENTRRFHTGDLVRNETAGHWEARSCTTDSLSGQVAKAATELEATLPKGLTLRRRDAPPFWQPQAPVLVMRGENLRPAGRNDAIESRPDPASASEPLPLRCRRSDELLRGGNAPAGWPALHLPTVADGDEKLAIEPLLADVRVLLDEMAFLDPPCAPGDRPAGCTGVAPASISQTRVGTSEKWKDPFLPLYLLCTVTVTPLPTKPSLLEEQFVIDMNSVDFAVRSNLTLGSQSIELRSAMLLTARAADPLAAQVRHFQEETGGEDEALAVLAQDIPTWPLLSQAAGGINELLLGCELGLQMAPFNPYAANVDESPTEYYFTAADPGVDPNSVPSETDQCYENSITYAVANCVGNQAGQRPTTADAPLFSPLRSGLLAITGLHIVDVFGRRLDLFAKEGIESLGVPPTILPSWRLAKPDSLDDAGSAFLSPRLAQPARLLLDWLTAGPDALEDTDMPTASPICGWVVPDHIDESLMLFDADGTALCSIGMVGGHDRPIAQPPAGRRQDRLEHYMDGSNPHLQAFASLLMNLPEPKTAFPMLLQAIDEGTGYAKPATAAAAQAQAVLMGQPLALVQAALRFELKGVPALNPSTDAFEAEAKDPPVTDWRRRDSGGIMNLRVPVHLGDHNMIEDGLILWEYEGHIYAPSADEGPFKVTREAPPLSLAIGTSDDAPPAWTVVRMLIDPLASVHVSCGLLPVVRATLPPDMVAAALAKIELSLFTNPILRPAEGFAAKDGKLALPLPAEEGQDWSWITGIKQGGNEVPKVEPAKPSPLGDSALWGYSPLSLEDGWLTLSKSGKP